MKRLSLSSFHALIVLAFVVLAAAPLAHAQCADGAKDGSETDVDCGGGACPACAVGRACLIDTDCQSQRCTGGLCACSPGQVDCGGACVDLGSDVDNCGACGSACPLGGACFNGMCTCPPGRVLCGGSCADLTTDLNNCGACGHVCPGGAMGVCASGVCQGASSCFDTVKDGSETDVDCGGGCPGCAVGRGCIKNADCQTFFCANGACACQPGQIDCGGACLDLSTDPKNCGACGNVCQGGSFCVGGACQAPSGCLDGFKDGGETDVDCGGGACPACAAGRGCLGDGDCQTLYCANGVCACQPGQVNCNGVCFDLSTDPMNCGACGHVCQGGTSCAGGVCQAPSGCLDGIVDGSETDIDCGGGSCPTCGVGRACLGSADCQSQFCSNGVCVCMPGQVVCGAACADLVSDAHNCGACGHACGTAGFCVSGTCVCAAGSVLCPQAGCAFLENDPNNCGGCGRVCAPGSICQAGICQVSNTCHDKVQDGNETGVDCGGSCPPCAGGLCIGSAIGDPEQTVSVEIPLSNGAGVAGFQVDVLFDPTVLDLVAVHPGADTPAPLWSINGALVGLGRWRILADSSPPTGLGPAASQVARVDFHIHGPAGLGSTTGLGLTGCVLSDARGAEIQCSLCPSPGNVLIRPASSFSFGAIAAPVGVDQFDPLPFPVSVQALNAVGDPATLYDGNAAMSVGPACAGALQPASLPFSAGLGSASFAIACCLDGLLPSTLTPLSLQAADASIAISGASDPFAGVAKGDVNADNSVNVLDVVRAVNLSLLLPVSGPPSAPPIPFQSWAANMLDQNCLADGATNVLDVVRIRNKALGRTPLCICQSAFMKGGQVTAAHGPAKPFSIRLERSGGKDILVKVSGVVDLSGLQLELKGAGRKTQVVLDGLTAGRNWQASTTLNDGVLRVAAFSNSATGVSGDGVVLRITGGGNPRITSVVAADSDGRAIPTK